MDYDMDLKRPHLSKRQKLKQKKLLLQMRKEINFLRFQIKHPNLINSLDPNINREELIKLLEIRLNNYNRLMGNSYERQKQM